MRVGVNEIIFCLLLLSVGYQTIQIAIYKPHDTHESHLLQMEYVAASISAPPSEPAILDSLMAAERELGSRHGSPRREAIKRPAREPAKGKAGSGGSGSVAGELRGVHGTGLREHKDLPRAAHRMGWLHHANSVQESAAASRVVVEQISEEEANKLKVLSASRSTEAEPKADGEEEEVGEAEEEEPDMELFKAGDKRQRPITLGGEPSWHHPMSGVSGGIGAPKVYDVEPLYMLDKHHFHLHQKQFETDGTRGGWLADNGKLRSAILRYPTIHADGTEGYDQTQFNSEDLDMLPYNDSHWRFETCAIVSNSGSLLNSQFGDEIDAHQMVTRINHAPVLGFRRYVGVKTTFDICNRPHAHRLSKISVLRQRQNASLVLFESLNWNVYYRLYRHLFKAFPFPGTVVLSPDLMIATMALWKRLAIKFPKDAYSCSAIKRAASQGQESKRCQMMKHDCDSTICKPSSGFFALVFAAQMCNQITMYGFEAYRFNSRMAKSTKYHYFDDETGTTNVHSFVLLMKVFKYLSTHYPITLRTSEEGQIDVELEERRRSLRGNVSGLPGTG